MERITSAGCIDFKELITQPFDVLMRVHTDLVIAIRVGDRCVDTYGTVIRMIDRTDIEPSVVPTNHPTLLSTVAGRTGSHDGCLCNWRYGVAG
jgi:hypothetical protein